jgi:hypothetical protein
MAGLRSMPQIDLPYPARSYGEPPQVRLQQVELGQVHLAQIAADTKPKGLHVRR